MPKTLDSLMSVKRMTRRPQRWCMQHAVTRRNSDWMAGTDAQRLLQTRQAPRRTVAWIRSSGRAASKLRRLHGLCFLRLILIFEFKVGYSGCRIMIMTTVAAAQCTPVWNLSFARRWSQTSLYWYCTLWYIRTLI